MLIRLVSPRDHRGTAVLSLIRLVFLSDYSSFLSGHSYQTIPIRLFLSGYQVHSFLTPSPATPGLFRLLLPIDQSLQAHLSGSRPSHLPSSIFVELKLRRIAPPFFTLGCFWLLHLCPRGASSECPADGSALCRRLQPKLTKLQPIPSTMTQSPSCPLARDLVFGLLSTYLTYSLLLFTLYSPLPTLYSLLSSALALQHSR